METMMSTHNEMTDCFCPAGDCRQGKVGACLESLPALYRTPVLLVDVQGLGCSEAASALKISKETLKSRLARGRVKLQVACSELARYWLSSPEKR